MATTFSWNAKTPAEKKAINDQKITFKEKKDPLKIITDSKVGGALNSVGNTILTAGKNAIKNTVDAVKNPSVLIDRLGETMGTNKPLVNKQEDGKYKLDREQAQKLMDFTLGIDAGSGIIKSAKGTLAKRAATAVEEVAPKVEDQVASKFSWNTTAEKPAPVQRGTQPNKFNQEPGNYDTPQGNIYTPESQLPTIQMGSAKAESTLPSIQIGEKSPRAVPGDFKYVPVQAPKTVTAPRTSPLENIPGYKAPEPVTTQNLPESNAPQVPKTDTAPEIKASQKKALEKTFKDDPTFEPSSFDEQIDSFNNELSINKDKVLDLATGRISQYGTLRPDTAHALLTNMEDSLDNATKLRLVNSSVPSVSGGNLGMNRLRDQDSTISILRDIKNKIENKLGKNTKNAMNNEESSTIEKFKKTLKDTIPDKQTIDNALAAITCKI